MCRLITDVLGTHKRNKLRLCLLDLAICIRKSSTRDVSVSEKRMMDRATLFTLTEIFVDELCVLQKKKNSEYLDLLYAR